MVATINASVSSSGIVSTADGSGILKVQSNGVTTNALAWVNFNGTSGAVINKSYNVSSVTRNSTGNYTVNFTVATSDGYYCVVGSTDYTGTTGNQAITIQNNGASGNNTTGFQFLGIAYDGSLFDNGGFNIVVFGN